MSLKAKYNSYKNGNYVEFVSIYTEQEIRSNFPLYLNLRLNYYPEINLMYKFQNSELNLLTKLNISCQSLQLHQQL